MVSLWWNNISKISNTTMLRKKITYSTLQQLMLKIKLGKNSWPFDKHLIQSYCRQSLTLRGQMCLKAGQFKVN